MICERTDKIVSCLESEMSGFYRLIFEYKDGRRVSIDPDLTIAPVWESHVLDDAKLKFACQRGLVELENAMGSTRNANATLLKKLKKGAT